MRKLVVAALLLSGCALRFARTHTCDDVCPRLCGSGTRNLVPGGPVNAGTCYCAGGGRTCRATWAP